MTLQSDLNFGNIFLYLKALVRAQSDVYLVPAQIRHIKYGVKAEYSKSFGKAILCEYSSEFGLPEHLDINKLQECFLHVDSAPPSARRCTKLQDCFLFMSRSVI